jgi:hypothetical protein
MNRIWIAMMIILLPFTGNAQQEHTTRTTKAKHKKAKKAANPLPGWAKAHNYDATSHAYFPDYYTYYDPTRGGYVYWDNGKWTFSPSVPSYLDKVDLSQSRVQILKGLSLDLHPEQDYPHYMEMYPPDPNGNTKVPVQIPGNPGNR